MSDIKIVIDNKAIDVLNQKARIALARTADTLRDTVRQAQIVPRDTGLLQERAFVVDVSDLDKGIVHLGHSSDAPYARRLYYHPEYNFRKDKNPNAQGLWFSPWLRGGSRSAEPKRIFEGHLKGLL